MTRFLASLATCTIVAIAGDNVAPLGKYTETERRHWAFQPRSHPTVPTFQSPQDKAWVRNPVDAFILARLKKEGLTPAAPAERRTLIRRVYFDLTGLPPTPAEVNAFVADRSRDAYPKIIDCLLDSPHYGERWGQHWLDVVRFAESDGFEYDTHRPDAWRYRDYVIRAFNNDKPYNRFLTEQLAGDEIAPKEDETLIAAGFNRLGPLRKNAGNQDVAFNRNEVLTEMTNITGAALLGVTLGCARCHDHKFDPFRQSDYYRMQAYFAAVSEYDVPKSTAEEQATWKAKAEPINAEIARLKKSLAQHKDDEMGKTIQKEIDATTKRLPATLPTLFSVKDDPDNRFAVHLLARGDARNPGDAVHARPIGVLLPPDTQELPDNTPNPRAHLAEWITDPANPLTARVMVNRIWEYDFGRGIVGTPNDFGRMGERPVNPELLDYLANEFVESGWSVKHVQKLILLSSTYQQASNVHSAAAQEKDPDNRLLWRFDRRRLDSEELRDAMLSISGTLNEKAGGPSVTVPIDQELISAMYKPEQWAVTKDSAEHNRRSVYLLAKRNFHLPLMEVFDSPDLAVSCPRRESSTHAPQTLELLNGTFSNAKAKALADRLKREVGSDLRTRVNLAYELAAGRPANQKEMQLAVEYLQSNTRILGADQAYEQFALAVFNLNAYLYVN
jgi:Protein of unknown function (DUF1553)/Protein of unknown function (DUF1549)